MLVNPFSGPSIRYMSEPATNMMVTTATMKTAILWREARIAVPTCEAAREYRTSLKMRKMRMTRSTRATPNAWLPGKSRTR